MNLARRIEALEAMGAQRLKTAKEQATKDPKIRERTEAALAGALSHILGGEVTYSQFEAALKKVIG